MAGEKVPYHCGDKSQNCGFCVSKVESTSGTMLYSHLGRNFFLSIQTNLEQIYVHNGAFLNTQNLFCVCVSPHEMTMFEHVPVFVKFGPYVYPLVDIDLSLMVH